MRVTVFFFGVLKDIVGQREESIDIEPNTTVGALFERYAQRFETLHLQRPSILFARNQEFATAETMLSENDEVAFLPPVSGGSANSEKNKSEEKDGHVFELTRDSIDTRKLTAAIQGPEDGAVVVFEGVVRNNTKGRATTHLDYEGYEGMALHKMKSIGREIVKQFSISRLGIVHRLGTLQIGEASVVIIASAPHRKAAFDAAFEAINRLKREVPIWKKEYFADGAVWVDGEWDPNLLLRASQQHAP